MLLYLLLLLFCYYCNKSIIVIFIIIVTVISIIIKIGNLSYPDKELQDSLGENVCFIVSSILLYFSSSFSSKSEEDEESVVLVLQECLRALRNISHGHEDNTKWLLQWEGGDVCLLLSLLLDKYSHRSDVLQWVWFSLGSLAQWGGIDCLNRLGRLGVCGLAVQVLLMLLLLLLQ